MAYLIIVIIAVFTLNFCSDGGSKDELKVKEEQVKAKPAKESSSNEESSTIRISFNSDSPKTDKKLIQDYNFMNKNIGVYKSPTVIKGKKNINVKTWVPYIEASASLAAKFSGENGASKIREEYGKSYEFTYDEQWEMISKDRFNADNIPDMLNVYFDDSRVMALVVKRYFSYDPSNKREITNKGYKTLQIIPRSEFLQLTK
jgi:hypothetical protein